MDLPSYLVKLMDARNVEGKELARRLGVRPSYISQVRCGKRPITPQAISKWVRALQLHGPEAEEFRVLALMQHGPPELQAYVADLRKQLAERSR